ncbi:MAG: endonuclease NucS [Candidatus Woesearchaeota archaeon]
MGQKKVKTRIKGDNSGDSAEAEGDSAEADTVSRLNSAIKRSETVILGCNCEVNYSGRAESHLAEGDRVIMIKEDKTMLVHQPTGSNPVNYMKQQTVHEIRPEEGSILLKSSNPALKEYLDISIKDIYFISSAPLKDGQKIQLQGSEKDMADMIMAAPEIIEEGFSTVKQEEQTKYGFVDVLGQDMNGNMVVVECKRYKGSLADVTQLRRYVEKIKKSKGIDNVRGVLAANGITSNALRMLEDWGYEYRQVKPPKYQERFSNDQKSLGDF